MKKILPLLAGTLLLVSTHLSAQKASEVISSVPLPAELADFHSWQPGMTQCDADGNLMVLSPARDQLLKVGLNGGIVLRIAVSGIAGLGELEVRSFASAPNGELYVMANQVFHKEVKADADSPTVRTVRRSGYFMFLRFDTHGELIANKRFEQRYVIPWMAVFDSGEFLMIEWRKRPVARLYSADLALLKEVDLAKTALAGHRAITKFSRSQPETERSCLANGGTGQTISELLPSPPFRGAEIFLVPPWSSSPRATPAAN